MRIIKRIFKKNRFQNPEDGNFFKKITFILGFKPENIEHYRRAFTHRSMNKTDENGYPINYERLEFLGDAMLGSVIAAHLFSKVPNGDEGYLTKMRSKIVSREHLNELGKDFKLIEFVETKVSAQHFGENVHGNIFEAFIGAIYLDKGFDFCEQFIQKKIIKPYVDIDRLEGKVISYKSLFIEWCQKEKKSFHYETYDDNAAGNVKYFAVKLHLNGEVITKARATSKKKAEEIASKRAYFVFQSQIDNK
ncbi:ribonuclease III [Flavobacterium columnare]|uniref:Ribonuclease 3 n=2 Tax=Flavobacterium columnare TaxID=996 RepID=G8XBM1_FLACA|nr:ribonuclease III [Flavobacterium columnare]AEW87436.1 ribonuclease III [Flavobacterium columnare ATCC 49512]AMO20260.1 ribonuclease III [Flavobacterium columnare]ANO49488.1 ribonuclease III [Flavobacterium columnare]APT22552.1 ribonuclease III [Flavobacterium columnare]AUX18217.1 ribonuclease III [Flavobacterium columnare]